jgi:hypothetical protein
MDFQRPCGTLVVDGDYPCAIAQVAGAMARAQSELDAIRLPGNRILQERISAVVYAPVPPTFVSLRADRIVDARTRLSSAFTKGVDPRCNKASQICGAGRAYLLTTDRAKIRQ